MNKILKYSIIALTVIAVPLLTACDDDDDDYSPGEAVSGSQVYFSSDADTDIEVTTEESSFSIPVQRANTSGSVTVPLTISGDEGSIYTIATSVTFSDGESEAEIIGTYDPDDVVYDDIVDITITIDDDYSTPYGNASETFSVGMPAPWESLGNCTFVEDFMTTFYSVGNDPYEVEIEENSVTPGYYRLVNPFGAAYYWNEEGDWDDSQDWYLEIHAEDPDGVYIYCQETGMDWGYGNVVVGSLAGYFMENGNTLDEVKEYGYTGTLVDGIITFPYATLLIKMPDYYDGYYYANYNSAFMVALPGVVLADYGVSVSYFGQYTDSSDDPAGVIAEVTEIGDDVDYVRVGVVAGTDVDDASIEAITEGTVSYAELTATGQVLIPWDETPEDGRYTIVAIAYADDEAQETATATFKYSAPSSETWTEIATGDYEYVYFWEGIDEGLTLYQSDADATRYKIEHWGYDVDFCFTYDQSTGSVVIDDQETGYEYDSYGMVYVMDLAEYVGDDSYGVSYYEDGVFYFNTYNYVSTGYFGYGYETFTLSDPTAVAAKSVFRKSVKANSLMMNKKFVTPRGSTLN